MPASEPYNPRAHSATAPSRSARSWPRPLRGRLRDRRRGARRQGRRARAALRVGARAIVERGRGARQLLAPARAADGLEPRRRGPRRLRRAARARARRRALRRRVPARALPRVRRRARDAPAALGGRPHPLARRHPPRPQAREFAARVGGGGRRHQDCRLRPHEARRSRRRPRRRRRDDAVRLARLRRARAALAAALRARGRPVGVRRDRLRLAERHDALRSLQVRGPPRRRALCRAAARRALGRRVGRRARISSSASSSSIPTSGRARAPRRWRTRGCSSRVEAAAVPSPRLPTPTRLQQLQQSGLLHHHFAHAAEVWHFACSADAAAADGGGGGEWPVAAAPPAAPPRTRCRLRATTTCRCWACRRRRREDRPSKDAGAGASNAERKRAKVEESAKMCNGFTRFWSKIDGRYENSRPLGNPAIANNSRGCAGAAIITARPLHLDGRVLSWYPATLTKHGTAPTTLDGLPRLSTRCCPEACNRRNRCCARRRRTKKVDRHSPDPRALHRAHPESMKAGDSWEDLLTGEGPPAQAVRARGAAAQVRGARGGARGRARGRRRAGDRRRACDRRRRPPTARGRRRRRRRRRHRAAGIDAIAGLSSYGVFVEERGPLCGVK